MFHQTSGWWFSMLQHGGLNPNPPEPIQDETSVDILTEAGDDILTEG